MCASLESGQKMSEHGMEKRANEQVIGTGPGFLHGDDGGEQQTEEVE